MCVKRRQHWILLLTWMFETVLFFVVNQQSHILHGFKPKSKVTVFTWMFCNVTWILKVTVCTSQETCLQSHSSCYFLLLLLINLLSLDT